MTPFRATKDPTVLIRAETEADHSGIGQVNRDAFGGDEEARLVELLRSPGGVITSLVAVDDSDRVVGHILFSPVTIVGSSHETHEAKRTKRSSRHSHPWPLYQPCSDVGADRC